MWFAKYHSGAPVINWKLPGREQFNQLGTERERSWEKWTEQISAIKTQLTTLAPKWIQFLKGSKIAWSFWFDDINKPIRRNIMSGSSESPGAMPMDAVKAAVLLQPCLKCWPQPSPVMILWLLAGEWFIRSLAPGLLSLRAIKVRIIVSRDLGTICSTAAQSEMWPTLQSFTCQHFYPEIFSYALKTLPASRIRHSLCESCLVNFIRR